MAAWKIDGVFKADANKVEGELNSLRDALGRNCTPSDIVERARDENSEMHNCFEWDDSVAGEKYRETQARHIIRLLVSTKENNGKVEKTNIRVFVSSGKNDSAYVPTRLVVRNQDEYEALLSRAYAELRAFKKKYATLSELEEILALID